MAKADWPITAILSVRAMTAAEVVIWRQLGGNSESGALKAFLERGHELDFLAARVNT